MNILIVHNAYQHKGGEDSVMEAEVALLASHGHRVELFSRHNDELAQVHKAVAAMQTLWSSQSGKAFESMLRSFKPDVVHVHNTFPLISPSIYWVADRLGVPVVQTLHNFRLLCPQAMFLRDGKVCEDCLGKLPWRGAVRGCYRDSKLQSTVLASMITLHRAVGTWQNKVTRYIALNDFCRSKFVEGGLPAARIVVKPNFVDFESSEDFARSGFLFAGRLSMEKGIDVLATAMALLSDSHLKVAGVGPCASLLEGLRGTQILGHLTPSVLKHEMSSAIAVVAPSVCYETFGMVVVEAFAAKTPVIASNIGVLPNLVKDGVTGILFESGNAQDLAVKMLWAQQHPEQMAQMGKNARTLYQAEFTAERNYQQLMAIYQDAIAEVKENARQKAAA